MLSGYAIGVVKKHFAPLIPFISDGGSYPPERCVFALFLNLASFFGVITFYMRYRQTVEYYVHYMRWKKTAWHRLLLFASLVMMYVGIASVIGLTIVANFPVSLEL
ncbi:hypothetical protein OSTOST_05568, partial [Ostertagia ostertagi]